MKAVVSPRYGRPDVLEIREMPKPVPNARQVLVAVHAAAVGRTDCGMLAPHPPILGRLIGGLFRPQPILGMDFAGVVEAVGSGVTKFKPDDRVSVLDFVGTTFQVSKSDNCRDAHMHHCHSGI